MWKTSITLSQWVLSAHHGAVGLSAVIVHWGKSYNLTEELELRLIEDGLKHNGDHWIAQYPWIRDPLELPDNYSAALVMLEKLEKQLQKNKSHAQVYQ